MPRPRWVIPLPEMLSCLERVGRRVRALEELLAAHRLWSDWLWEGRVRKFAFVAEKAEMP